MVLWIDEILLHLLVFVIYVAIFSHFFGHKSRNKVLYIQSTHPYFGDLLHCKENVSMDT